MSGSDVFGCEERVISISVKKVHTVFFLATANT